MKTILLLVSFFILASCTSNEEINEHYTIEEIPNNETEENPGSTVPNEAPRVIEQMDFVEFIDSHKEAEFMQEQDFVQPENIHFDLYIMNDPEVEGVYRNRMEIRLEVEAGEELRIGSTHFRLEHFNGDVWEQIDNVPYGEEDAQAIITHEEPFERGFSDIDQFETDFDTGVYRFVNSGYTFPFYVYVLD